MNFELPHDVVFACAKRDEPPSQQTMSSSFRTTTFALARSVTNRRAAGAVCSIRNQRPVSSLNPSGIVGPAARLSVYSVYSVV